MLCCGTAAALIASGALWRRLAAPQRWFLGIAGLSLLAVPAAALSLSHQPIQKICGMPAQ